MPSIVVYTNISRVAENLYILMFSSCDVRYEDCVTLCSWILFLYTMLCCVIFFRILPFFPVREERGQCIVYNKQEKECESGQKKSYNFSLSSCGRIKEKKTAESMIRKVKQHLRVGACRVSHFLGYSWFNFNAFCAEYYFPSTYVV
jgi:hypothetical protein